jgi:hypothetical protein
MVIEVGHSPEAIPLSGSSFNIGDIISQFEDIVNPDVSGTEERSLERQLFSPLDRLDFTSWDAIGSRQNIVAFIKVVHSFFRTVVARVSSEATRSLLFRFVAALRNLMKIWESHGGENIIQVSGFNLHDQLTDISKS